MPTLLETQRAMRASLVDGETCRSGRHARRDDPPDRLNIYRNTFVGGVTKRVAAGLSRRPPAGRRRILRRRRRRVHRAASAALGLARRIWRGISRIPAAIPPAAIARLSRRCGAPRMGGEPRHSMPPMSSRSTWRGSAALSPEEQARVSFVPHPSVSSARTDHPADAIWRAVLDRRRSGRLRPSIWAGPVRLMVERGESGPEISASTNRMALCRRAV